MSDSQSSSIQPLSYGDISTRFGVIHEKWPGGMRITKLPGQYDWLIWIVSRVFLTPIIGALTIFGGGDPTPFYRGFGRTMKPLLIEVNDTSVSFINIPQQEDCIRPRTDVYEVKFVHHSGNLFIRAHGHQIIDFRPFNNPIMLRWIADELREALGLNPNSSL